jgi:anti-sigma factor RsiW
MEHRNLGHPSGKHIDDEELNVLVPWPLETGQEPQRLSPGAVREAERHVKSCGDCSGKVSKYRQIVNRLSNGAVSQAVPSGADCPKYQGVDWNEVTAGLWPDLKAKQLIVHATLCEHCGPLLRAATSLNDDPTPQEEELLAQLKAPSRPDPMPRPVPSSPPRWPFTGRLIPAVALILAVGVIVTWPPSSSTSLSGQKFSEFAVSTHRQHVRGSLALDVRSESQQTLNEWFEAKSPFPLALPASPAALGEERSYRLEGARLMQVIGKTAVYVAYQMQAGPASLVVAPDSVAVASGGVELNFQKLSFHYRMVEGYKVVTWSLHGRTYALVSQEGNSTQRSCMICHSALRDRDLSQMPTPLPAESRLQ